MLHTILISLAINLIKNYVLSSESKNDDKILELVKYGADYLSAKNNNDLTTQLASEIFKTKIKG